MTWDYFTLIGAPFGRIYLDDDGVFGPHMSMTLHLSTTLEGFLESIAQLGGHIIVINPYFGDLNPYYVDVDKAFLLRGLLVDYLMYWGVDYFYDFIVYLEDVFFPSCFRVFR